MIYQWLSFNAKETLSVCVSISSSHDKFLKLFMFPHWGCASRKKAQKLLKKKKKMMCFSTKDPIWVLNKSPEWLCYYYRPRFFLSPSITCPQYLSHTSNTRCHWCISAAFLPLSFSFSVFNLLSSPPSFHHWCKAFIHMPAIPDCIPVNRTSMTAYTSACCLSLITASQTQLNSLSTEASEREWERSFHMSGALFLVNSRWHHSPTILSSSPYQCFTKECPSWLTAQWMCRLVNSSDNEWVSFWYFLRITHTQKAKFRQHFHTWRS